MRASFPKLLRVMLNFVACSLFAAVLVAGQSAHEDWAPPRTPDGHPDLRGVWANNNVTPLERSEAWTGRDRLTDEELAALRIAAAAAVTNGDALFGDQIVLAAIDGIEATSYDPTTGNYNQFWITERDFTNRTSLVVDPPNGKIPDLTEMARERRREMAAYRKEHPADSYMDRPLQERCVSYGIPRLSAGYNSYYQVFQNATHLVILHEMIHDARVIPIDGRQHLNERVRQLHGDSRGHWEGETLVIETINYSPESRFRGSSDKLRLVERLTRVAPNILNYEVTIADPTTWTQPWTALIPLMGTTDPLFEYACHEGNVGMEGILAGHRAAEGGRMGPNSARK